MDDSRISSSRLLEDDVAATEACKELISSLPRGHGWFLPHSYQYDGFWYPLKYLKGAMTARRNFQARNSDLLLCTTPKSGTTWLKALAFSIVNRTCYSLNHHPLLHANPHDLVPHFLYRFLADDLFSDLNSIPSPRLLATHLPYTVLKESVLESSCRIVYLCRNPADTFVSLWHFVNKLRQTSPGQPLPLEEAFELFCSGISTFGPFWDHVLGYWKESLERPDKVLFLKYEEIKQDPAFHLKRLAEFLGYPFSPEEEREGVVEDIVRLCSFENLSNLEVNKTGQVNKSIEAKSFFRKGVVGDSANYLTPSMRERLDELTDQKFAGSGLSFLVSSSSQS